MNERLLQKKLAAAKQQLSEAEAIFENLLKEIAVSPRANKTTISGAVEAALAKLHTARTDLEQLETMVMAPDDH